MTDSTQPHWEHYEPNSQAHEDVREIDALLDSTSTQHMRVVVPSDIVDSSALKDENTLFGVVIDGTNHAWRTLGEFGGAVIARVYKKSPDEALGDNSIQYFDGYFEVEQLSEGSEIEYSDELNEDLSPSKNKKLLGTLAAGGATATGAALIFIWKKRQ